MLSEVGWPDQCIPVKVRLLLVEQAGECRGGEAE